MRDLNAFVLVVVLGSFCAIVASSCEDVQQAADQAAAHTTAAERAELVRATCAQMQKRADQEAVDEARRACVARAWDGGADDCGAP